MTLIPNTSVARRCVLPLLGPVLVTACADGLTSLITLTDDSAPPVPGDGNRELQLLLVRAEAQLRQYLAGARRTFTLPLAPNGTGFQRRVWQEMNRIPRGQTLTYAALAERLGSRDLARPVGQACGRNPLPLFQPCHRVTGSRGSLGGFSLKTAALQGMELKRALLELEQDRGMAA